MIYTFGDSILASTRYSGVTAGEIVAKALDLPYKPYAVDGATSDDLDRQWLNAVSAHRSTGSSSVINVARGIAMVSVGGNDLIQYGGMMEEYERFRFAGRLTRLLQNLRRSDIKAYVANIYDPTFGSDDQDFLGISEKGAARRNFNLLNATIEDCLAPHAVLVDLHAHFLTGAPAWYAFDIEPSETGAQQIAKDFLE